MTGDNVLRFGVSCRGAADTVLEDEDLIRFSVAFYLRGCGIENFVPPKGVSTCSNTTHCHPLSENLGLLIADARTSIVLAVQRHLENEQYRKRLAAESHYRLMQPYLSEAFQRLMVRASNLVGVRYPEGREPKLAEAYKSEIDRLEKEWRTAGAI